VTDLIDKKTWYIQKRYSDLRKMHNSI